MQQEQAIAFDGCASPWMTAEPHSTAKIRGLPCARHRGSWMLHWGRGEVLNSPMCVPERQMCSKSCHCLSCDRTPLPCHAKTDVFKVLPLLVMRSHTTALSCMVHHHCLVMQLHTTAALCVVHLPRPRSLFFASRSPGLTEQQHVSLLELRGTARVTA